ncbi:MAG: TetR/AcrR family transcriptional regulator [Gammaproteobacteria bacterium]|jgi:AcrR family transcriptional regulator
MAAHAPAEVRRDQVLNAALKCFARNGYHATRVDDIVAEAGLSKGAIYHRFRSKDEIFLGLFDAYEAAVWHAWEALPEANALDMLEAVGHIVLETVVEPREYLRLWKELLAHPAAPERFSHIYAESRTQLTTLLERGVRRQELNAMDVSAVAALLTATIEGLLLQALMDERFDAPTAWRAGWPAMRSGLERREKRPARREHGR